MLFTETSQHEEPKVSTTTAEASGTTQGTTGRSKRKEEEITKPIGKVTEITIICENEMGWFRLVEFSNCIGNLNTMRI